MGKLFDPAILKKEEIKVDGTIKKVVDKYRQLKVPMRVLLTDYYLTLYSRSLKLPAINPYVHLKGLRKEYVVAGASAMETAYASGVMELVRKKRKPTDVIRAVFYRSKALDDSAFELSFLLPLFFDKIFPSDSILIVNPSPSVILYAEKNHSGKKCYLVSDETVSELYRHEFPDSAFYPFSQAEKLSLVDRVLVINGNQGRESAGILLDSLKCCSPSSSVLMCVPSSWFDRPEGGAYQKIRDNGFSVDKAVIVATDATNTVPRKKLLLFLDRNSKKDFTLYMSQFDSESKVFSVSPEGKTLDLDQYFRTKMSILSLWNREPENEFPKKVYSKSSEYRFSREISIFYRIYDNRKNGFSGMASYRKTAENNLNTHGKAVLPRIEKGLRGKSAEEVMAHLEDIPFNDRLYLLIRRDVLAYFFGEAAHLTLKTLWFCVRDSLLGIKKYREDLVKAMFSPGNEKLSDYIPGAEDFPGLICSVSEWLKVPEDEIPFNVIEQLDLIFENAVRSHLLSQNPMEMYFRVFTQRATDRQQETRQALVKKQLTEREEGKIVRFLLEKVETEKGEEIRAVSKSIWLSGLIRLFTGMALREAAALKWGDFQNIDGTDDYSFTVNKSVDGKGKTVSHRMNGRENRIRIVPVTRLLRDVLIRRKKLLLDSGISEDTLLRSPIILQEERRGSASKERVPLHCKPWKITDICSQLIKKAEIPEELIVLPDDRFEMVTDIYRYLGDIFLSNFTYKAKNAAGFTNDEVSYVTGTEAPNTLANYYCDYFNPFIQVGMIQKLERWSAGYRKDFERVRYAVPYSGIKEGGFSINAGPFGKRNTSAELIIHNESDHPEILRVDGKHGTYVEISEYGVGK